ncbi:GNAT family N-acetyltransferase [Paenibacillus sp. BAC0078]
MLISLENYWDRDAVALLLAECMWAGEERALEELDNYLTEDSLELLGTFVNGELAGLLGIRLGTEAVEIRHLAVQARLRGRGIGSAMIEELRKCKKAETLQAETDKDAARFYRNCGFMITSLGEKYPGTERFNCVLSSMSDRHDHLKNGVDSDPAENKHNSGFLPRLEQAQNAEADEWSDDEQQQQHGDEHLRRNIRRINIGHGLTLHFKKRGMQ